jgi:RNA polymerase sigma-B factor
MLRTWSRSDDLSGNANIAGAEALVQEFVKSRNPDLREEIVRQYTSLVERVARKYSGLEPFEDLVQVGFIGLLNALNMFEPSKGVRFNTYATHLVAGSIKHHLRDKSKIIREPAWLQEVRHKVNKAASQMLHELGRVPTDAEIGQRTDVTPQLVREVLSTEDLFKVTSLTSTASSDDDSDGDEIDLAEECADQLSVEERFVLENAIGELRDLERDVLQLFHFQSLSQTEIGQKLGISPNYVSHILRQSLSKLRTILNAEERNDRTLRRQMSNLSQDVIDETTEAYSEEYMMARLDEECARASCDSTTVAFIHVQFEGLDRLRQFYGAETVESFLRDACAFLRDGVRRLDIVGRCGDTGFGIVLPGAGEHVSVVYSRLQDRIVSWLCQESVARAGVVVLFGSAFYPNSGRNGKSLRNAAKLQPLNARPEAA